MLRYSIFCLALLASLFCTECYKDEPSIITKNVIDTLYITTHDTIVQQVIDTLVQSTDSTTTFILVRHAETTGTGSNPALSLNGQVRAANLARILEKVPIQAVYSTNYTRTMQTAQPTATDKGVTLQLYDPLEPEPVVDDLLATYHGQAVLVVGHSNTVPELLNLLTGSNAFAVIPEAEYDNLYVVTVFEKGRSKVVHLKYGN